MTRTQRGQRTQRALVVGAAAAAILVPASPPQLSAQGAVVRVGVLNGADYEVVGVPLEAYVARVLAGEAAPGTAPAALNALAIAVRTYTAANMNRHEAAGFDLCDQTHCQVMRTANADTDRAAAATAGQVLLDRGTPAVLYYSASCGGRTELPSAVWPGSPDPPHLPAQDDDGCEGMPVWSAELASRDLQRALQAGGYRGTLRDVRVVQRNGSGRVARIALDGMTPAEISGQDLRMVVGPVLGWRMILSAAFELRRNDDSYRFTGRGSGHGVGMCVIGAMKRAEKGETTSQILAKYYPGLALGNFAPDSGPEKPAPYPTPTASAPPFTIRLGPEEEGERAAVTALVTQARSELSRLLGVAAPARMLLTFHASATDYERVTGQLSFTSTAERDGTMHFLPVRLLRDRGILDRTIRRAVVRAMTAVYFADRRAWVREGAALYFADPPVPDAPREPRVTCPADVELEQPVSGGALSEAYARARSCFARQAASGRDWREIR